MKSEQYWLKSQKNNKKGFGSLNRIFFSIFLFSFILVSCSLFIDENDEKYEPFTYNKDGSVMHYASDKYFGIAFDWNYTDEKVDSILASYNLIAERKIWDNAWTVYSKVGRPAKEFFTTYKRPATTLGDSSFVQYALPRVKNEDAMKKNGVYAHLTDLFSIISYGDSSATVFVEKNIPNSGLIIAYWNQLYSYYSYGAYLKNEVGLNHQEILNLVYSSDDSLKVNLGESFQVELHGGDEPLLANKWQFKKAEIEKAWDITKGIATTKLAVIDNSIDTRHPDFGQAIVAKANFTPNGIPTDPLGDATQLHHGTSVLGLMASQHNSQMGVKGVAPNAKYVAIKGIYTQNNSAVIDYENIKSSFVFAANNNVAVINNSYGIYSSYSGNTLELDQTIQNLLTSGRGGKGVAIVFSSGNASNLNRVDSPLFNETQIPINTINVGATNQSDKRWGYSNGNFHVHIAAPAGNVGQNGDMTTLDGLGSYGFETGDYNYSFGGTSAAAPLVSGTIGLMLSVNPDLTLSEIETILANTADKVGGYDYNANSKPSHSFELGYGRLNAYKAVKASIQNVFDNQNYSSNQLITDVTLIKGTQNQIATSVTLTIEPNKALLIDGVFSAPNNSTSVIEVYGNLLLEENSVINKTKIIIRSGGKLIVRDASQLNGTRIEVLSEGELSIDDNASVAFDNNVLLLSYGTTKIGAGVTMQLKNLTSYTSGNLLINKDAGTQSTINISANGIINIQGAATVKNASFIKSGSSNFSHVNITGNTTKSFENVAIEGSQYGFIVSNVSLGSQNLFKNIDGNHNYYSTIKATNSTFGIQGFDGNNAVQDGISAYSGSNLTLSGVVMATNNLLGLRSAYTSNIVFNDAQGTLRLRSNTRGIHVYNDSNVYLDSGTWELWGNHRTDVLYGGIHFWDLFAINSSMIDIKGELEPIHTPLRSWDATSHVYFPGENQGHQIPLSKQGDSSKNQLLSSSEKKEYQTKTTFLSAYFKAKRNQDKQALKELLRMHVKSSRHEVKSKAITLEILQMVQENEYEWVAKFEKRAKLHFLVDDDALLIAEQLFYYFTQTQPDQKESAYWLKQLKEMNHEGAQTGLFDVLFENADFTSVESSDDLQNKKQTNEQSLEVLSYPNPFNPTTNLKISVKENARVTIQIFDIMGRLVQTLVDNQQWENGTHEVTFDASHLASGMYFARTQLVSGKNIQSQVTKLLLIK